MKLHQPISRLYHRLQLRNRDFSIISDNCWGGFIYQRFGLRYLSPFIWMFMTAEDYLKMVVNLKDYLSYPLVFTESSKNHEVFSKKIPYPYPIALLKDVEIHFQHYKSQEDVVHHWNARVKRINWDNLIFKFCDRYLCLPEHIKSFDRLPFEHKVCFTARPYPNLKSTVFLKRFADKPCVDHEWRDWGGDFNLIKFLNDHPNNK